MPVRRAWIPLALSTLTYLAFTAFLGRDVLLHLGTTVASDAGDPLFAAAILKWNATHVPLTDAWWQFPIFFPTRDTLTFSEHFLGVSLIASPIYWLTHNTLLTYNLVLLLSFPLCALAMYALAYRLSGSAAAAFVAGFAFAFAPYRMGQLSHVQLLSAFPEPLALLGLHAYLTTAKRRWLVLYGAAWAIQSATSAYSLVFFSLLVGLWVLWFVVMKRRWHALAMIAAATVLAALPLVPIVQKYVMVHAYHGFQRSEFEAQAFSADLLSVLCAPVNLSVWGWLRVGCYPRTGPYEVELYPGIAVITLCGLYIWLALRRVSATRALPGWLALIRRLLIVVAILSAVSVTIDLVNGPWQIDLGFIRASSSSVRKPLLIGLVAVALALLLSPRVMALSRSSSTTGFYLLAAVATWLLALGPTIAFMGVPSGIEGPFSLLRELPGASGIRVPARFWSLTCLSLAIVSGMSFASVIRGRSRTFVSAVVAAVGIVLAADGWLDRIATAPAPSGVPDPVHLAGRRVVELPMDAYWRDIIATYRAVEGDWTAINGYSGYVPSYYYALSDATQADGEDFLAPLLRDGSLDVLVPADAPGLLAMVQRQPGAILTARNASMVQFRLPQRARVDPMPQADGRRLRVTALTSTCSPRDLPYAIDGDITTAWECAPRGSVGALTIDLGGTHDVGRVVHGLGRRPELTPKMLDIETSEDGIAWRDAWSGRPLEETIAAGRMSPADLKIVTGFATRRARFIRLSGVPRNAGLPWLIAELEIWSGRAVHD